MQPVSRADDDFDVLDRLVLECIEPTTPTAQSEALDRCCRAHPDLAHELRRRVRSLECLGLLLEDSQRFGPFRLIEELGRGGMGVVHLAAHDAFSSPIALKRLRPELIEAASARARFHRETETLRKLDHPGICKLLEVGEIDGQMYLAMEFLEGDSLQEQLDAARRSGATTWVDPHSPETEQPVRSALRLMADVADAVSAAHDRGIVHRDIKPSNLMFRRGGQPVLLDFGLAHHETALTLTASGALLGTPQYMAPEQIESGTVDHRADVHALGVLLYECLTLRSPYTGRSREDVFRQILTAEPRDPRRANPEIDAFLAATVERALAKRPEHRYPDAKALAADLRLLLEGEKPSVRPPSPLQRLGRAARRRPIASAWIVVTVLATLALVLLGTDYERRLRSQNKELRAEQALVAAREYVGSDPARAIARLIEVADELADDEVLSAVAEARQELRQIGSWTLPPGACSIATAPNDLRLAIGFTAPVIGLIDLDTRSEASFPLEQPAAALAWSADGEELLVVEGSRRASVYPVEGLMLGEPRWTSEHLIDGGWHADGSLVGLRPDGWFLLLPGDEEPEVSAALPAEITAAPRSIDYLPARGLVAVGFANGEVAVWRGIGSAESVRFRAQECGTTWLRFLESGLLVTLSTSEIPECETPSGFDHVIRLWSVQQQPRLVDSQVATMPGFVLHATCSEDRRFVLTTGTDGHCVAWSVQRDPVARRRVFQHMDLLQGQVVDGARFVCGNSVLATWSQDGQAKLWGRLGQQMGFLGGHVGGVLALGVLDRGALTCTIDGDSTLRVFDATSHDYREHCGPWGYFEIGEGTERLGEDDELVTVSGRGLLTRWRESPFPGPQDSTPLRASWSAPLTSCAWSPGRKAYIVGLADGTITAIRPGEPSSEDVSLRAGDGSFVRRVVCLEDTLAAGIDLDDGRMATRIFSGGRWTDLDWTEQACQPLGPGHRPGEFVVGSSTGRIALFDVEGRIRKETPRRLESYPSCVATRPAPHSDILIGTSDGSLWRWQPESNDLTRFDIDSVQSADVCSIAVGADGVVATGDFAGHVTLWSAAGRRLLRLRQPARVSHVLFHGGGRRLGWCTIQGHVRSWEVERLLQEPNMALQGSRYLPAVERASRSAHD